VSNSLHALVGLLDDALGAEDDVRPRLDDSALMLLWAGWAGVAGEALSDGDSARRVFETVGRRLAPIPVREAYVADAALGGSGDRQVVVGGLQQLDAAVGTLSSGKVTGVVELVPFADLAYEIVVHVQGDSESAIVSVPRDQTSVHVDRMRTYDECGRPCRVVFDGASGVILAEGPDEVDRLIGLMGSRNRAALASEAAGIAAAVVDQSVRYAKHREQFGRTISSFQAVQHLLAGAWARSHTLAASSDRVWRLRESSGIDGDRYATIAYLYVCRELLGVVETAIQVHGAIGYTQEKPLHSYLKRALTLIGAAGEQRDLLVEHGRAVVGGARSHVA